MRLHGLPHDEVQRGQQLATREPMLPLQLRDLLKSHLQVGVRGKVRVRVGLGLGLRCERPTQIAPTGK